MCRPPAGTGRGLGESGKSERVRKRVTGIFEKHPPVISIRNEGYTPILRYNWKRSRVRKKADPVARAPSGSPRFGRFGRTHGSENASGVSPPLGRLLLL
eukprot:4173232-Pyramimonas_sp.AAC.1